MSPNEPTNEATTVEDAYSDTQCERIRRCPGMYIGDTGNRGLHRLVLELLANSVDAFVPDSHHVLLVALLKNGGCKVVDDGRGFPVDPTTENGKRNFELFCTEPGCRFPQSMPYRPATGLHGVGLKAVNALSRRMTVEVDNHGKTWRQEFQQGKALSPVTAIRDSAHTGTSVTFWPDPEIFPLGPDCQFSWDLLCTRLRDLAFFHPSGTFPLIDDTNGARRVEIFHFPEGLRDYVRFLNREAETVHPHLFRFVDSDEDQRVEIALQWTRSTEEQTRTFCNDEATAWGGSHLTGFRAALTRTLLQLLREQSGKPSRQLRDTGERCRRGLTAVVTVTLQQPLFESATKDRLYSPETESFVQRSFARHFRAFLRQHPTVAAAIVGKLLTNLSVP